jgi:hypothetical protein
METKQNSDQEVVLSRNCFLMMYKVYMIHKLVSTIVQGQPQYIQSWIPNIKIFDSKKTRVYLIVRKLEFNIV